MSSVVQFTDLNNQTRKLMPAPFVTVTKSYDKAGDGEMLGCNYDITLTGTIVAHKGSPQSDGDWITTDVDEVLTTDQRHKSVLNKIKAISNLFSSDNDGGLLEINLSDGTDGFSAHVQIDGVDFSEGNNLVQKTTYTINLTTSILYGPAGQVADNEQFPYNIQSADESWDLGHMEETSATLSALGVIDIKKSYQLTHTMTAVGKPKWDATTDKGVLLNPTTTDPTLATSEGGEAWHQALLYIKDKIGTGTTSGSVATGYQSALDMDNPIPNATLIGFYGLNLDATVYGAYNYTRTQQIDKKAGSVSITETWILASATTTETIDISIDNSEDTDSSNSTNSMTISGTIRGLAVAPVNAATNLANTDDNETKYINAKARLAVILPFMDNLAKVTANEFICSGCGAFFSALPDSKQVGINRLKGEITYSFVYTDKHKEFGDGIQSASFNISDTLPAHVLAVTPVMGRKHGPVIQDAGSQTEYKRSLSIDITVNKKKIGLLSSAISLQTKLEDLKPSNFGVVQHALVGVDLHPAGCLDAPFNLADVVACNNVAPMNGRTIREQLADVIESAAPTTFLKFRVSSPPSESWDIGSGKYTFRIEWIYEKTTSLYPLLTSAWVGGTL